MSGYLDDFGPNAPLTDEERAVLECPERDKTAENGSEMAELSRAGESPEQAREWAILEHWNEINAAYERKRIAEANYAPPNCDWPEGE